MYLPPERQKYVDYFAFKESFSVKGNFQKITFRHIDLSSVKGEKGARIEVGDRHEGHTYARSSILLSANKEPRYRIYGKPRNWDILGPLVAEVNHGNDLDVNKWVEFWVKTKLLDESVLPVNIKRKEVDLGTDWYATHGYGSHTGVSINTTSLVYIKGVEQGGQLHHQSLVKRDFWLSNIKSE